MATLTGYFDASGRRGEGIQLVVSGFISTAKKWEHFERQWQQMLDKAGIKYFRMAEFTSCTGQFAAWRDRDGKPHEKRRRPFLQHLIDVIVKHADQSFAAGVLLRDWERCDRIYEMSEQEFQPYSMCGWTCVDCVYGWCKDNGYSREQVAFTFEDGDLDKGHLESRLHKDFGIRLRFGGKIPDPNEPPLLPLQAADFAAWHVRRLLDRYAKHGSVSRSEIRYDFEELFSRVPYSGYHRHLSMTASPVDPNVVSGKKFALVRDSSKVPSLVRFCVDRGVPHR